MPELKETPISSWVKAIFEGIATYLILEAFMPINWGTMFFGICWIVSDIIIMIKTAEEGDLKLLATFLITNSIGGSNAQK